MNNHVAQEIFELLTDGLNEYNWDYVLEASRILARHLEQEDALDRMADNARELGLDY